jgi:hypothetical protein
VKNKNCKLKILFCNIFKRVNLHRIASLSWRPPARRWRRPGRTSKRSGPSWTMSRPGWPASSSCRPAGPTKQLPAFWASLWPCSWCWRCSASSGTTFRAPTVPSRWKGKLIYPFNAIHCPNSSFESHAILFKKSVPKFNLHRNFLRICNHEPLQ